MAAGDVDVCGVGITHLSVLEVYCHISFCIVVSHHTAAGAEDVTIVVARSENA